MATANPTNDAAKGAAEKAAYIVVSPLQHDKKDYLVGDEVKLTEAQAAPLLGHTVKAKTAG